MTGYTYKAGSTTTECLFVKNLQGDVERVISDTGTVLVSYTYDAWGSICQSSGSFANINPIRYRSYYYDPETGLYYLQSRYYDPHIGRFVNADGLINVSKESIGLNLFAYCNNNPITQFDKNGLIPDNYQNITKMIVDGVYGIYYQITYWHYEQRDELNSPLPNYDELDDSWIKLSEKESIYHDNGIGLPEEKYIHNSGREAVYDGNTKVLITDPQYKGTFNYCNPIPVDSLMDKDSNALMYFQYVYKGAGHVVLDVVPYYIWGNERKWIR